MANIEYAISVLDSDGQLLFGENESKPLETMSGIKSIVGNVALNAALLTGESDDCILEVTTDHLSNGSGLLKNALRESPKLELSLREVLYYNIRHSDCVATNALIDYTGGVSTVNERVMTHYGLDTTRLIVPRLNFDDFDHDNPQPEVGLSTMRDLARYYQKIWSGSLTPEEQRYRYAHAQTPNVKLFDTDRAKLPASTTWFHKSGSGDSVLGDRLHSVLVDAGQLNHENQTFYVAAGLVVRHQGPMMPSREYIRDYFARRNIARLAMVGVDFSGSSPTYPTSEALAIASSAPV